MIKASIVLALIGLCVLAASLSGAVGVPFYLPLSTLVLAGIVFAGRDIPKFLRIFLVMLSGTHLVLVALILGAAAGAITGDYTGYVPPPSAALGATAFGAIIFGLSYVPVVRTICRIADRYLDSQADSVIRIPLHRPRAGARGHHRHLDDRHPHRDQPRPGRPQRPPQLLLARHVQCARSQGCRGLLVSALRHLHAPGGVCSWPSP